MLPPLQEYEITPVELSRILQSEESPDICLIDCREEDEFALCRIDGGELLPLSRFAELAHPRLQEEDRPVIVYCHHGMRSMNATMFLREKGIEKVWSLAGGIDLWSKQIDPSVPRY